MNVQENDELVHQFGEEPFWRESLFFNWHDSSGQIAGSTTIGIRPNQHCYEGLAILFVGKRVLFFRTQGPLESPDDLYSVPGLTCTIDAPLQRWRIAAKASFFEVEGQEDVSQKTIPVDYRLSFDAVNPVYSFPGQSLVEMCVAREHYEQCGHFRGSVVIEGNVYNVDGLGFRDHSWGVRNLNKTGDVMSLYAQFASDFTVNAVRGKVGEQEMALGYVWRDGRNSPVTGVHTSVEVDPLGLPGAAKAQITADGLSPMEIQVEVKAVMPITLTYDHTTVRWCECFAQFSDTGGHGPPAYGIMETTNTVDSLDAS